MDVRNLLSPERVVAAASARSRKHALEMIGELLARASNGQLSATEAFDAMFARERLGCTGLGNGVAMPHGRVDGLAGPVAAFMRLSDPVEFDTPDGAPVDLVFALLVPSDREACQSEELAELSRLFADREFRRLLRVAGSARGLLELFPGPEGAASAPPG